MRNLRATLNVVLVAVPLLWLWLGARAAISRVYLYLTSGSQLARALSTEASLYLNRRVTIQSVKLSGSILYFGVPDTVELSGVSLADGPDGPRAVFVSAARATLNFTLAQILQPSNPMLPVIDRLSVDRPEVSLYHGRNGKWNFEQLLKPGGTAGRPFADRILFYDGTLYYSDKDFPHPSTVPAYPLSARVTSLRGTVYLRGDSGAMWDASGMLPPDLGAAFHSVGIYSPAPKTLNIRVVADRVSMPFVSRRFVPVSIAEFDAGTAAVSFNFLYRFPVSGERERDGVPFLFNGTAQVQGLSAKGPAIGGPVTSAAGPVTFVGDAMQLALKADYAGQPVTASGRVWNFLFAPRGKPISPAFDISGTAQNADLHRIYVAIPAIVRRTIAPSMLADMAGVSGHGSVDFKVLGTDADPAIQLMGMLSLVKWRGRAAHDVAVQLAYAGSAVDTRLEGKYAGGTAQVTAHISTSPPGDFQVTLRGRAMRLENAGIPGGIRLAGTGDVDAVVTGQRDHTPRISAQAHVARASFGRFPFDTVYARAETRGHDLVLKVVRVRDRRGTAVASGTMNLRNYNLNVQIDADDLDLNAMRTLIALPSVSVASESASRAPRRLPFVPRPGALARRLGAFTTVRSRSGPLGGVGYIRAALTGNLSHPVLAGRIGAFGVTVSNIDVDDVTADMRLSRDRLWISHGVIHRGLGSVQVSGVVTEPFARSPHVDITGRLDSLDLPDLLDLAGISLHGYVVGGAISTTPFHVVGMPGKFSVPGSFGVTVADGMVNGQQVSDAAVDATYTDGTIHVLAARAAVAGGSLAASGSFSTAGKINLRLAGADLNLNSLEFMAPHDVSTEADGRLSFMTRITGTVDAPSVEGTAQVSGLKVNGYMVGDASGSAVYHGGEVTVSGLRVATGTASSPADLTVSSLQYDLKSGGIRASGAWTAIPIQRLREIAQASVGRDSEGSDKMQTALGAITGPISGVLSGSIELSGTAEHPRAEVHWSATDILVNGYPISSFNGSALVDDVSAVIPSASLTNREAGIDIEARNINAVYDGDISGEISAYKVDLGFLQRWILRIGARARDAAAPVSGQLTGDGDIGIQASGRTRSPVLEVSMNLRNVGYLDPRAPANAFPTIAHVDINRAVIQEGSISGSARVRATDATGAAPQQYDAGITGSVGFSWSPPFLPPAASLNISTGTPEQPRVTLPFQAISYFSPYVIALGGGAPGAAMRRTLSDSIGTITASARVGGTIARPDFEGSIEINAPRLKLAQYNTGLADVFAGFDLNGDRIVVRPGFKAHTQVYLKGVPDTRQAGSPIAMSGSLPLGFGESEQTPPGALAVSADRLVFDESPVPTALDGAVKGEAHIDSLQITGSLRQITVAGDVHIRNSTMRVPTTFSTVSSASTQAGGYPQFKVRLHVDNGVTVNGPMIAATVTGTVDIGGSMSAPEMHGSIDIARGELTLPGHAFTIVPPGNIAVTYPVYTEGSGGAPSLQVTADIRAQTRLFATSATGVRKNYLVTVAARGPLLGSATDPITGRPKFNLTFTSDPPDLGIDQADMVQQLAGALVGTGDVTQFGANPTLVLQNVFAVALGGNAFQRIIQPLERGIGIDIQLQYDPVERLNVTLSRQLFGPFYVTYFRTITGVNDIFDLKLSYRFNSRYELSWDEHYEFGVYQDEVLVEGVWRF